MVNVAGQLWRKRSTGISQILYAIFNFLCCFYLTFYAIHVKFLCEKHVLLKAVESCDD